MIRHHRLKRIAITIDTISRRRCQSLSLLCPAAGRIFLDEQHTNSNLYEKHYFHTSMPACKTRNDETETADKGDVDRSKEWIPPSRPLTGDSSQSNLYVETKNLKKDEIGEETRALLEKQLGSDEGSVRFVDLTDMDLDILEYASIAGNIEGDNSIWKEITDDEEDDADIDYDNLFPDEKYHIRDENDISKEEDWTQDAIIREYINDPDIDPDDKEIVQLQGQLIAERIRDLRTKNKNDTNVSMSVVL